MYSLCMYIHVLYIHVYWWISIHLFTVLKDGQQSQKGHNYPYDTTTED